MMATTKDGKGTKKRLWVTTADMMNHISMTVHIRDAFRFRARVWIACRIIMLAARVLGARGLRFEFHED